MAPWTRTPRWLAAWTAIEARPDAAATSGLVLARVGFRPSHHYRYRVGPR